VPKAELEAKVNELAIARKTIEDLGGQLSRSSAKVEELQSKLSDSVPRTELETIKSQLESNIVDLQAKLAVAIPRSEARELGSRISAASRPAQTSPQKAGPSKCPLCKYKNRSDAIYCGSCGHKLEDEKGGLKLVAEHSPSVTATKTTHLRGSSRLKALIWSGFKSQKNLVSNTPSVQSGDLLETQLTKLKSLYESGALTETEYQREKKKLLGEL
jgi:hypothetical protein